jgi:hypothetical protein
MRIKYLHTRPLRPDEKIVALTREQTRAMSLMEPIGNPNCDTYNDPVSAVLSVSAMAGTYAAAGSFAAMTFAQGMIFAGSAISLAGNVTGNSSLMKIGAGVALVGGVSAAYDAFNSEVFSGPLEEGIKTVPGGEGTIPETLAKQNTLGNQAIGTQQAFADPTLNTPLNINQGTQVASIDTRGLGTNIAANTGKPMTMAEKVFASQKAGAGATGKATGFVDYINKNPGVALVGASTLGPALGSVADYASGKTQAEMDALKADAEYKRAVARAKEEELAQQELNRQRLNDPTRYTSSGIINARRRLAPVTDREIDV